MAICIDVMTACNGHPMTSSLSVSHTIIVRFLSTLQLTILLYLYYIVLGFYLKMEDYCFAWNYRSLYSTFYIMTWISETTGVRVIKFIGGRVVNGGA